MESMWMGRHLFLTILLFASKAVTSQTIVTSLPGFSGTLPFTLETGYVGVGESEEVQLFYYFVESQSSPSQDPLMLYIAGGPGCSSLSSLLYENGPIYLNYQYYDGGVPSLNLSADAWTQSLNMIYIDAPVGTGFSYSNTSQGYYVDDAENAAQTYEFLRKWLVQHPDFLENELYIAGVSYSGIPVPMIVNEIIEGNILGLSPGMNIKGYVLGSPVTDSFIDDNSKIPFAHGLSLISHELYNSAKTNCEGNYVNVSSEACALDIEAIDELLRYINVAQVLHPYCYAFTVKPSERQGNRRSSLEEANYRSCDLYSSVPISIWANDESVRAALNVRNGTKGNWQPCNSSLTGYTEDVTTTLAYHRNFSHTSSLRALIYNGDHDMSIPNIGTQEWIRSLNMTLADTWRAWMVDAQVAGYTKRYTYGDFSLTYATVKGAGHIPATYKTRQCYEMIERWLAHYPL
ncbi:Serine carboxypeptidase-like 18 [Vitis vinifera]|uniref:Serine carboxypeptidase-like 18 n=1 Tax=Vitis vinifera TaxID=29760 RepID=A0A438FXZ2_VITVI|nr:Serine carboxypeptidase-like 18 [Vitis vinifera]